MSEESTQSITIDAEPTDVMAVIADFTNYPTWAASVKRAQVLESGPDGRARRVAFTLDAGIVRDQYELAYVWSGAGPTQRVDWDLVRGEMMRAQRGSYALSADAGDAARTLVTYTLSVDLIIPMLGMLKRKAERVVMDTALNELKKRVESLRA